MRVAVVTGRHVFEVVAFHRMLRSLTDFDFYVQHMEDFCADNGEDRDSYDAVLFFHMLEPTPTGNEPWPAGHYKAAIEQIPSRKQGIVLLHHSLVAWPDWNLWSELVGIHNRKTNKVDFKDVASHVEDQKPSDHSRHQRLGYE